MKSLCPNCGAQYRPASGHTCLTRRTERWWHAVSETLFFALVVLAAVAFGAAVACGIAMACGVWR